MREGSSMQAVLIRGGQVVTPGGAVRADVLVEGEPITAVGRIDPGRARDARVLEADGRLVMPGFVDAHSHAEGAVFEPEVQLRSEERRVGRDGRWGRLR